MGSGQSKSLKQEMLNLLDEYLLGHISAKDLKNAVVPMLMVSTHKRGRKNYIEKYLLDISGKPEEELTREYLFSIRETIGGEQVTSEKDRKRVFKRTLRKLIERYFYEEIDETYYLSTLYDMMVDFETEWTSEKVIKDYFEKVQSYGSKLKSLTPASPILPELATALIEITNDFYESYYKGLWDE